MLELYYHPLASYCWKVLVALYDTATPFEPHFIDLGDPAQRAELGAVWPFAKFPVLRDRDVVVPESTIIIDYLARHVPGAASLVPADDFEVRKRDRFFDLYVHDPMQRIVAELLKPTDPAVAAEARRTLAIAYGVVDGWSFGDTFTMADCAAAPALFYADQVCPIEHARTRAYLDRLLARPSMQRVRREAQPYWHMFPGRRD